MIKKLVKTRSSRKDVLEIAVPYCACVTCDNCSGGGSWRNTERSYRSSRPRGEIVD